MAVAGSLLIEIGMDVARLQVDVDKARGSILNMEKGVFSLKNAFNQLAAATGIILGLKSAWDLVEQSASLQEQQQALANLSSQYGITSDAIIASMQRAADGTISKADAIKLATKGMMIELNPDQLFKFTELSKTLGNALGKSIEEVMDTIERATVSGAKAEVTLKKELGVIIDLDSAYQRYAVDKGMMINQMTDEEKRLVTINELMKQSESIIKNLGSDTSTMADAMERFKATIADVKITLGEWIATIASTFAGIMALVAAGAITAYKTMLEWVQKVMDMVQGLVSWMKNVVDIGSQLPIVGKGFESIAKGFEFLEKKLASNKQITQERVLTLDAIIEDFDVMSDKAFKMAGGIGKVTEGLGHTVVKTKEVKDAVVETVFIVDEIADHFERLANARALSLNDYEKALEDIRLAEMAAGEANSQWLTRSIMNYEAATNALNKFQQQQTPQQSLDKDIVSGFSPLNALIVGGAERIKVLDNFHKQELDLLADKQAAEIEMYTQFGEQEDQLNKRRADQAIAWRAFEAKQTAAMDRMKYTVGLQMLGGAMLQTGQTMMSMGQKNFELGKKIAIAGAILNTAGAVMSAMNATPIYWVNIALAATTAAMGAAQIEMIRRQQFMGGGIAQSANVGGGGVFSGPATTGNVLNSDFAFEKERPLPSQNITINVYNPMSGKVSDELADAIITAINDAPNRNVTINAQAVN